MSSVSSTEDLIPVARKKVWAGHRWLPILRLGSAERRLILAVMDYLLLASALIISVAMRTELLPTPAAIVGYGKWFVTLALVWFLVATVFDAYNLARAASTTFGLYAAAASAGATSLIYLAIPWLTPALENRTQAFLFILLATLGLSGWRFIYARLFAHPAFQRRALIVGTGRHSFALAEALQKKWAGSVANPFRGTGYILLGFVDPCRSASGEGHILAGLPVLGGCGDLTRLARTLGADEIIVAPVEMAENDGSLYEALLDCRELGIPITNLATLYERLTGRVAVEFASSDIESVSGHGDGALLRSNALLKRMIDLTVALLGLWVVLLLMAVVALANAWTSPGPLFFRQQRVGQGGRPFKILKFRTMVPDAERLTGAIWADEEDSRVTPIGWWLRKTHLDELPQAFNILRGEMSIVGPRPERPEFVGHLARSIPYYRARHSVRPGLTGWAQIHQSYGDTVALAQEKLEYDLFYVKRTSFLLDTLIMLRTVAMVLGLRGR
jgi:exopolysaccharide biosynthesis polyprenyl glycosylphosphotransferase